jgi:hypothetical protein
MYFYKHTGNYQTIESVFVITTSENENKVIKTSEIIWDIRPPIQTHIPLLSWICISPLPLISEISGKLFKKKHGQIFVLPPSCSFTKSFSLLPTYPSGGLRSMLPVTPSHKCKNVLISSHPPIPHNRIAYPSTHRIA